MHEAGKDRSQNLLLVDDDEVFRQVLGRALSKRGYQVHPAATIEEALSSARLHVPDFAVVDLKLQHESGLDLLEHLKALNTNMRIVLLTGYASIASAVTAMKRGASNYLAKPAMVSDVIKALHEDEPVIDDPQAHSPMSVGRMEWEHIQKVLQENDGNISATARSLGMYRRTLQRKLAKKPLLK